MLNCKLRSNKSQSARLHRRRHIIFFRLPPTPYGIYENGSCTPMHFLQSIMTNPQPPRVCWITFFINQFTLVEILLYVHLYSTGNWICHINAGDVFSFVTSIRYRIWPENRIFWGSPRWDYWWKLLPWRALANVNKKGGKHVKIHPLRINNTFWMAQ